MNLINKKYIPYYVIAALLLYILMIGKKETVEVVIPSKTGSVEISDPKPEKEVDTVYIDKADQTKGFRLVEVENPLNQELLQKYEEAVKTNDSLQAVKVFKEAIKERKYTEVLEDSVQVITVKSEVVGTLKRQFISYETKPKTVIFKTGREKPKISLNAFVTTIYSTKTEGLTPSFGVAVSLSSKKRIINIGLDHNLNVVGTIAIKLF